MQENLVLFAAPGKEKEAIERAVDVFPVLGERPDQPAGTMSGGEQQMLALARAYILGRGRITFAGDSAELVDEDVFHRYLGIELSASPAG